MKKIFILFIVFSIAAACSDFIEEDNRGGVSNDFYKTADGYETLINAAYNSLRGVYGSYSLREEEDEELIDRIGQSWPVLLLAGTDLYQKTRQNDHLGNYEYESLYPSDDFVKEFYVNIYEAIQVVNAGLFYNDAPADLDEEVRATYRAELRFLRAFYHFLLVEQFGGIPINDEITLEEPRLNIPKSSLSECYDFIISEIEECITDLDSGAVARVNVDVANHYLAKIYLTRGWDLGNASDFESAKSYAQKVFDSRGDITLTYGEVWSPYNENNSEILFAVQYDAASILGNDKGNTQQALFGQYMGGSETHQKLMLTQLIPSWSLHSWYAENDNRYDETFMLTVYENYFDYYTEDTSGLRVRAYYPRVWNGEYTDEMLEQWLSTHDTIKGFRVYPFLDDEEAYRAEFQRDFYTPTVKKFDSPQTRDFGSVNSSASVRDIVLARLAETYFIYAEACIGLNDFVTASTYVQVVLDRPGNAKTGSLTNSIASSATQEEALHQYLIESGKEFVGEYNGRWPELRRTGMLEFMLTRYNYDIKKIGNLNFDTYQLRPIPEDAITLNDALEESDQNPGY